MSSSRRKPYIFKTTEIRRLQDVANMTSSAKCCDDIWFGCEMTFIRRREDVLKTSVSAGIMAWYESSKSSLPLTKNGDWNPGIVYYRRQEKNMEDNRNSDRSEEELRRIIREKIRRSRGNWGKNLCVRTQAMIPQASSALASSVNADSGISSPYTSSTSLSTNLSFIRTFRITRFIKSCLLSAFY